MIKQFQRLAAYPRELRYWLRHTDQTLLRMEARWVLRWFGTFPGAAWLIAYIFLDILLLNRERIFQQLLETYMPEEFPRLLLYTFTKVGFWIFFIQRRIGGFFRSDRLDELAVTPCTGEMLWPALCTAPALGVCVLIAVDFALYVIHGFVWDWIEPVERVGMLMSALEFLEWVIIKGIIMLFLSGFFLAPALVLVWSSTIFVVSRTAPNFNPIRLIWYGFLSLFQLWIGSFLMIIVPLMVLAGFFILTGVEPGWVSLPILTIATPLQWWFCFAVGKELSAKDLRQLIKWRTPEKILRLRQGEIESKIRERSFRTGEI